MLKLFRYLRPYVWKILLLLVSVGVSVFASLQLPALMAQIVNQGIVVGDLDFIWWTGVKMIGFAFLTAAAAFVANFLSARIGTAFTRDVRNDFFGHVLSFSMPEIDKFSTASLITRTTSDIMTVQQVIVMSLSMALRVPLTCIFAVGQAIATAPEMTWIIVLAAVVIVALAAIVMGLVLPKFQITQKLVDKLTLIMRENLTGLRVIRAFNNDKIEQQKFGRTNREVRKLGISIDLLLSLENPLTSLVFNGVTLLCIWMGITLISKDFSYLGNMMAFMQYAIQVVLSFLFLTMLFILLPRASVSAKRLNEVLDTKPKITWKRQTEGVPDREARVEFVHVSFAYPGAEEKVLDDVSFVAEKGKTTAFIGSTGSGKSTLINLVPRFFEVSSGEVKVDGINVADYAEDDLMRRIGYVPQKGKLFAGTVKSNILFGVNEKDQQAAEKRMKEAAKIAQASEFVEKMEGKYEARIAQGGANVSGGQRQRLAIARAIAKNPEIYIFDDAFSALDMKTDAKLRADLKLITGNAVTLIVAQRIGTIRDAEQIVVLDRGKVVGKGTHWKLMKECKIYQEIAKSQLSDEEFAAEIKKARGKND